MATKRAGVSGSPTTGSGNPFTVGSVPFFNTQISSNSVNSGTKIARPSINFNPQSSLDGLKSKLVEAQNLAANPLQSPGAQETLNSIKSQLANRKASLVGQAKGRATASGQAGFGGVMAGAVGQIEQGYGDALAQSTSDLALDLAKQGRDAEAQILALQAQQENEGNRILLQKYGYDTDLVSREAQLRQSALLAQQNNALEQARLAEQARQYQSTLSQRNNEFQSTFDLETQKVDTAQRQQDFDNALNKLKLGQGLNAANLLPTSGLNPLASGVGISGVTDVRVDPNKNKRPQEIEEEERQKMRAKEAEKFALKYGSKFNPKTGGR